MAKHSKNRSRRHRKHSRGRRMRGGFLGFFEEDEEVKTLDANGNPIPEKDLTTQGNEAVENLTGKANAGLASAEAGLSEGINNAKQKSESLWNEYNPFGSSDTPPVVETPAVNQNPAVVENPAGGRRRRKSMRMKGGRSNVGLSYYAAPVTNSVTAQPTYMMKYTGGKRKSCKRRRSCKRRTCKRKSCRKRQTCRHIRRSRRH